MSGGVLWALADHEGSIRDVISYDAQTDTATVKNHVKYGGFGNIGNESNPSVDFRFGYTGREWDNAVDLYWRGPRGIVAAGQNVEPGCFSHRPPGSAGQQKI
jgi:hypothetical protein